MMLLFAAALCMPLEGDRIQAGDLAKAVPAFAALPSDTIIALAPAFGVQRHFDSLTLERIAARFQIAGGVAAPVCFERPSTTLQPNETLEALRAAVSADGGDVEIALLDFAKYRVPRGVLEFPLTGLPAPMVGGSVDQPLIWRGRVRYGESRTAGVWAKVRIAVRRNAVVLQESAPAQSILRAEMLRLQKREFHPLAPAGVSSIAEAEGRTLRRSLRAGDAIQPAHLAKVPEVKRGDEVDVVAREGKAEVRIRGTASGNGSAGETVMVRNPVSGKSFAARVEGRGRVSVHTESPR
ncbi:MAG: flagellar basal body P-ring formation chaperone FlgA [Bryobacteraceae bacterium]|nr:flagellar basal body P-ring formation chaperone FlgA [Bryobacteraceae bacterium]